MRKDNDMEVRTSPSGYKYYPRRQNKSASEPLPKKKKITFKQLTAKLVGVLKNLPAFIMRAVTLLVMTPIMIFLFIFNLIKSLLFTAIAWFLFKVISYFAIGIAVTTYASVTNQEISKEFTNWFEGLMNTYVFPNGVPIYYGWETTIIVVFAIIVALSLTIPSHDA